MSAWKMNNCPKCGSDLFVDLDIMINDLIERCIICGYTREADLLSCAVTTLVSQGVTTVGKKKRKKSAAG